jgi:hypothetical protein
VVVNGDREGTLGMVLADDVVIEVLYDLARLRQRVGSGVGDCGAGMRGLLENVEAEVDTVLANPAV